MTAVVSTLLDRILGCTGRTYGVIMCDGLVVSGADDETKGPIGTSAKLAGYGLSIFFSLMIYVMNVFVRWVSADGGQYWVVEIDLFKIYYFGCSGHL